VFFLFAKYDSVISEQGEYTVMNDFVEKKKKRARCDERGKGKGSLFFLI
jgi:hypothetical protein